MMFSKRKTISTSMWGRPANRNPYVGERIERARATQLELLVGGHRVTARETRPESIHEAIVRFGDFHLVHNEVLEVVVWPGHGRGQSPHGSDVEHGLAYIVQKCRACRAPRREPIGKLGKFRNQSMVSEHFGLELDRED